MLKCSFDVIPEFLKLPDYFKKESVVIILGRKNEFIDFFTKNINDYLLTESFKINYSTQIIVLESMEKVINFKGAFGQNKMFKYNKVKVYSEKFYIDNNLYIYDIAYYHDYLEENMNLFKSGFAGFSFFSKKDKDREKYIFPIDFQNNFFGNIYINFDNKFINGCCDIKEEDIEEVYLNGSARVLGGDFFERYNNLKKDEKIIIKNKIDKIILKK
ncbi:TPA: hypothetical protein R7R87_003662 [Acinetobacter baumannii]|uniref:hypothetical protein n=1 Tax=Acinetobacter TaxID=469 RepID=UPI0025A20CFE|nr:MULTISPECIES: hypothetical protein [Acinetobacter]MCZ2995756.1 hypothetical protein [Acinetobacter baumannii]MDQ9906778.1 hypothetical protein [Acinetobacter sp. 148]HEE6447895.1 hypothetical protein [Acinetobacter baumannii]